MNKNALIIIAKYPEKDMVKTRLKGKISDSDRLSLYVSLLDDTVNRLRAIPGVDTFMAFAPADTRSYFSRYDLGLIPLPEGDLGITMFHAFKEIFRLGYEKIALVGADIPGLSSSIVLNAFEILTGNDVVFGPAEDGGYYLIGMKTLIGVLFEDIPWSSEKTLKVSIEHAENSGYSVGLADTLSDIDTIEDLKKSGYL